MTFELM